MDVIIAGPAFSQKFRPTESIAYGLFSRSPSHPSATLNTYWSSVWSAVMFGFKGF